MKTRHRAIGSFLLLSSLFVAACGVESSPSDTTAEPSPSDQPGITADPGLTETERARNEAQEKLRSVVDSVEASFLTDPDFSNMSMDAVTNSVIVYREGGASAAASARLPSTNPVGAKIIVRSSVLSKMRVDEFVERITRDQASLKAAGVEVVTWGPDGEGGLFHIGVTKAPAQALAVFRAWYPAFASAIDVSVQSSPVPAFGRLNDTPAYFGGSRINIGQRRCTTGFSVRNSYGVYMLTAYHCYDPADTTVRNGQDAFEGNFVSYDKTPYDAAFIKVSSNAAQDYAGALGNDFAYYQVTTVSHPVNGEIVCAAGSYSGARCDARIGTWTRFNMQSPTTGEVYSVDMWNADQMQQHALAGQGDSGGPLYVGGTSVHARGILSSIDPNTYVGCPEGPTARVCAWRVYFGDAAEIGIRHGLRFTGF